eukprot:TRINITY_DN3033_c0_g1_i1.p1 TRINITY_DN3033_c0_g1~~TRINITY_DN3033_c0_g1_i1.p1  ORF type:complete len:460 (+),score=93.75 TRINITY_DN3033_c0_g1_i1:34-1413(+)
MTSDDGRSSNGRSSSRMSASVKSVMLEDYKFGMAEEYSEAADTEAMGDMPPPLPPPPNDPNVVVVKKQDMEAMIHAMSEAAETIGGKNADLTRRLKKLVTVYAGEAFKQAKKQEKVVYKSGYRLGQMLEVRYVIDDIVHWDTAKVVPGSGGGLYSIQFDDGEIWDKIPAEDLRPYAPVAEAATAREQSPAKRRTKGSWNLATVSEHIMYNGWILLRAHDWMSRTKQQWGMVIGSKFYFGDTALCSDWCTRDLLYAEVKGNNSEKTIRVSNIRFDYAVTLQVNNTYEYQVWLKQLETAALRAAKNVDYTQIAELENEIVDLIKRPILPLFESGLLPEDKHAHTLSGSIVTASGGNWFGAKDWKRRYVTLHLNWLCIRTEKSTFAGLEIVPFRETKCWQTPMSDHPHTLEISGPFMPTKYLCFDDENTCNTWKTSINSAIATSNPEDTLTNKHATDQRGLV